MMFLTEMRPYTFNPKPSFIANPGSITRKAEQAQTNDASFAPRVSLSETTDSFVIKAELPGVTVDQLELSFEKDELTVKGEKPREVLQGEARWIHDERTFGRFERTFRFTTPVDAETIQAETRDGILTIRVAKAKSALPKKITVVARS
jgi:HSP20 family protein